MDTHTVLIEIIIAIAFKKYKLSVSSTLKFSLVVQMVKHLCAMQDPGSIPGLGRFPEEGNGSPLQYSCLQNSMDRGAWWAIVHWVAKS